MSGCQPGDAVYWCCLLVLTECVCMVYVPSHRCSWLQFLVACYMLLCHAMA